MAKAKINFLKRLVEPVKFMVAVLLASIVTIVVKACIDLPIFIFGYSLPGWLDISMFVIIAFLSYFITFDWFADED